MPEPTKGFEAGFDDWGLYLLKEYPNRLSARPEIKSTSRLVVAAMMEQSCAAAGTIVCLVDGEGRVWHQPPGENRRYVMHGRGST